MKIRFRHDRQGIGEVLRSADVQGMLLRKAEAVAEAARASGIKVEHEPGDTDLPVTASVTGTGIRARARVTIDHPSGLAVESKHGLLAGAIDAARNVE